MRHLHAALLRGVFRVSVRDVDRSIGNLILH